jgi:hypothetical protein
MSCPFCHSAPPFVDLVSLSLILLTSRLHNLERTFQYGVPYLLSRYQGLRYMHPLATEWHPVLQNICSKPRNCHRFPSTMTMLLNVLLSEWGQLSTRSQQTHVRPGVHTDSNWLPIALIGRKGSKANSKGTV